MKRIGSCPVKGPVFLRTTRPYNESFQIYAPNTSECLVQFSDNDYRWYEHHTGFWTSPEWAVEMFKDYKKWMVKMHWQKEGF